MKSFVTPLLALLGAAQAHYNFIRMQGNGIQGGDWRYMRKVGVEPNGGQQVDPMYLSDIETDKMRCNRGGAKPAPGIESLSVKTGAVIGFKLNQGIFHQGPLMAYMAKVPAGMKAATWDGSGDVWFKIFEDKVTSVTNTINSDGVTFTSNTKWANDGAYDVQFTIPKTIPNGEYLFRVEHLGLHLSAYPVEQGGGVQFFISCAHLMVTNGGTGTPGPLVAFPGAYKKGDPGLYSNIYNQTLVDAIKYKAPGPPVWVG